MRTYISYLLKRFVGFTLVSAVTACNVHEFPEEKSPVEFTLHLNFNTEMPLYETLVLQTRTRSSSQNFAVRYIVEAYRADNSRTFDRTAETRLVVTGDDLTQLNRDINFTLGEGYYRFNVWADYVDTGSTTAKFYNADDFAEILLHGDYCGNNDYRDAFCGTCEVDIAAPKTKAPSEVTVTMERPLAKFRFVSVDLDLFVKHVLELRAQKEQQNATAGGKTAPDPTATDTRTVDLNDFRVLFRYTGFMPCAFNLFINKPSDAKTGVFFESSLSKISETEAEIGFDYVFVNGTESTVAVSIEVYDKEGNLMSSTNTIDVPIVHSKLTIIRGEFLTSKTTGGIGVNPKFDGEWNFEIT